MHVGITFDLRQEYLDAGYSELDTAEFDRGETIDGLEDALMQLGHEVDRIGNVRQLTGRLAAGDQWELVFNICEGMHGLGRESQVPALLDAFEIAYTFADPCTMALCLHKGLAKGVIREAGLPTPASCVVEHPDQVLSDSLNYPLFVKPIAEGTGKGIEFASRVVGPAELGVQCRRLLGEFRQPVLVEEFLPGREFTVGLLGTGDDARVLGTMEILLRCDAEPEVYSYVNKEHSEELVDYRLIDPDQDAEGAEAARIALAAWRALNCRDGGRIDLRSDAQGRPHFLEANPLAGLHPTHSDLPMLARFQGISFVDLVGRIVASAQQRIRNASASHRPFAAIDAHRRCS